MKDARLVLEDGRCFVGRAVGATGEVGGEVCFNTSLTGYQEVLTDPSYRGQLVCMTYPLIGNVGVNDFDAESAEVHARGFILKEVSPSPSNQRSEMSLPRYLEQSGVIGITGIDTRALTRHIRSAGALRGIITTSTSEGDDELTAKAKALPYLADQDLVGEVTTSTAHAWDEGIGTSWIGIDRLPEPEHDGEPPQVVAYDFGIKRGILRALVRSGCQVTVVPARTPAAEVLAMKPDGLFLSNGPGDPAMLGSIVAEVERLVPELPTFGICLGMQILAQVFGAKTFKLKFGHRGGNHPVKDLDTGVVEITTQNHGYAVDPDSLSDSVRMTHVNLNDHTLAGLAHRELPVFGVQYHPEASPGPRDSSYLFGRFVKLLERQSV
ncbi:MAG: glutamine-hydrolyzing carbamoyl-phosphate synthase small subunit [Acidobacteriota bacterium]